LAVSACLLSAPALAEAPAYELQKHKSHIKFFAIQNGASVEGKFNEFSADIRFDPEHTDQSSIKVVIKTGSVSMRNEEILTNIKLPDWLSVEVFPEAVFTSKKINRMPSTDNYYAEGQLTLRDKTMPVVLNFHMDHFDDNVAVASGSVTLHRKDFGVGQGEWARDDVIKDEVRVEFRVATEKKK
jgi:polyisoprenoid-binding protein YceI